MSPFVNQSDLFKPHRRDQPYSRLVYKGFGIIIATGSPVPEFPTSKTYCHYTTLSSWPSKVLIRSLNL
jgi:hypothetical protein